MNTCVELHFLVRYSIFQIWNYYQSWSFLQMCLIGSCDSNQTSAHFSRYLVFVHWIPRHVHVATTIGLLVISAIPRTCSCKMHTCQWNNSRSMLNVMSMLPFTWSMLNFWKADHWRWAGLLLKNLGSTFLGRNVYFDKCLWCPCPFMTGNML